MRAPQRRVGDQQGRGAGKGDLGDQHQPAPVEGVGEGAADQGHRQQRHQGGGAHEADDQRGVTDLVGLIGDRHVGDHGAQQRDRPPEPQQAKVAVAAQRADVEDDVVQEARRAAGLARRYGRCRRQAPGFVEDAEVVVAVGGRALTWRRVAARRRGVVARTPARRLPALDCRGQGRQRRAARRGKRLCTAATSRMASCRVTLVRGRSVLTSMTLSSGTPLRMA